MKEMLVVKCINATSSTLKKDEIYYAFPYGDGTVAYISRFPRQTAHKGAFQMNRFEVIAKSTEGQEWNPVTNVEEPAIDVFEMHVLINQVNYRLYGFESGLGHNLLFTDLALQNFIGTHPTKCCNQIRMIGNKTKLSIHDLNPKEINLSNLERVSVIKNIENELDKIIDEQLSLF